MRTLPPRFLPLQMALVAEELVTLSALHGVANHISADNALKVRVERLLHGHLRSQRLLHLLKRLFFPRLNFFARFLPKRVVFVVLELGQLLRKLGQNRLGINYI